MKLLFDENLSHHLTRRLADLYPASLHVRDSGLKEAEDEEIWQYARQNDFVIVSKDSDFWHRSFLYGHPPKFIWLRVGNCPTGTIEELLRRNSIRIHEFEREAATALLILP